MHQSEANHAVVTAGGEVIGMFAVSDLKRIVTEAGVMPESALPLAPIASRPVRCAGDEELSKVVQLLRENGGAVLVGRDREEGILTTDGVLSTLAEVAEPFLIVYEIEGAIRAVIAARLSAEERRDAFAAHLAGRRGGPPSALDDLSMGDYGRIIGSEDAPRLVPTAQPRRSCLRP